MKQLLIAGLLAAASAGMGVSAGINANAGTNASAEMKASPGIGASQGMAPGSCEALVAAQIAAYNRHDLDGFLDAYSDDVTIYRIQRAAAQSSISGKAALREFYRTERFNRPGLRAQILHRTVFGNRIVDHERIFGLGSDPLEAMVVYAIENQHIAAAWIFSPE